MKKFGVILLAAAMCLGLAGCGSKADDKKADSEKVYAVEAGSSSSSSERSVLSSSDCLTATSITLSSVCFVQYPSKMTNYPAGIPS